MSVYSGADSFVGEITKQRKKANQAAVNAERLPYELTKAFREAGGDQMGKRINKAEQNMLNSGYEALDKYQNIENPFTRMALVKRAQGSASLEYKDLLTEQDRRQGTIQEYIQMWSGTYGAMAKAEQLAVETMISEHNMKLDLADRKSSGSGSSDKQNFRGELVSSLEASRGEDGYYDPNTFNEARQYAYEVLGMTKDQFDKQFGSNLNPRDKEAVGLSLDKAKEESYKEKNTNQYYKLLEDIREGRTTEYMMDDEGNIYKTKGKILGKGVKRGELHMRKP